MITILHTTHHSNADSLGVAQPNLTNVSVKVQNLILEEIVQRLFTFHFKIHIEPSIPEDEFVSQQICSQGEK